MQARAPIDALIFVRVDEDSRLMVMTPDGRHVRPLGVRGRSPQWSPNGKRIAFINEDPDLEPASIYIVDADGGEPRLVAPQLGVVDDLAWSPDGQTFAFPGEQGIYTLTIDEPNPRRFVELELAFSAGDFSPDGSYLAYYPTPSKLVARSIDGGQPVELTEEPIRANHKDIDWLDCS